MSGEPINGSSGAGPRAGRIMQTFRLPRELLLFLKSEAAAGHSDLTGHVVRILEGVRTWYGLPQAATALLEADRQVLGMERHDYLLHALFQRSLQLRDKGPGFDAPTPGETRPR